METTIDPLCVVNGYQMHPLSDCSEDAVATVYAKICQRGNPLLQSRPHADLKILGAALYRKALDFPTSHCFLQGSECVSLSMSWDAAAGGAWQGVKCPASLVCHSAVGAAALDGFATPAPGETVYGAFAGVLPGHPSSLITASLVFTCSAGERLGFRNTLMYTVHPAVLNARKKQRAMIGPSGFPEWTVIFSEIVATDEVHSELCSLKPGIAECWCEPLASFERRLVGIDGMTTTSKRGSLEQSILSIVKGAAAAAAASIGGNLSKI